MGNPAGPRPGLGEGCGQRQNSRSDFLEVEPEHVEAQEWARKCFQFIFIAEQYLREVGKDLGPCN